MKTAPSFLLLGSWLSNTLVAAQDDDYRAYCDANEDDPALIKQFEKCKKPFERAVDDLINSAPNSDAIWEITLLPELLAGTDLAKIKNITSNTFFCDDDFLENMLARLACDPVICGYTCEDLPDWLELLSQAGYGQVLFQLENCGYDFPSYCDLINPSH